MLHLRVQAIAGETTCFMVESAEVQCVNPVCSKLYRRTPNGYARFGTGQKTLLNMIGVWNKVQSYLRRMEREWNTRYVPGAQCPRCGAALAERSHRVDTTGYNCNGECGCEWFQFVASKELRRLTPEQQGMGEWRCSHIEAARSFDYDVRLRVGELYRLRQAKGQREESQP